VKLRVGMITLVLALVAVAAFLGDGPIWPFK
jgi:hypothetical protein